MTLHPALISLFVFIAAAAISALLFAHFYDRDRRVTARLNQLSDGKTSERKSGRLVNKIATCHAPSQAISAGAQPLDAEAEEKRNNIYARLMHAGIYSPYALIGLSVARVTLAVLPPLVGLSVAYFGNFNYWFALMWGGIGGGFGLIAPSFWLDYRKSRRHVVLNQSLPDAMDLLVTCVEGGLSLEAAFQRMTDELQVAHPILAGEMGAVQKQIEFGASPDAALRNFADRTDLESISVLSTLLQQARRFGTPIAETLRTHAETMRSDRELRAEELAQKAAVKILFPTLLLIFPAIFVILAGPAAIQLSEAFDK
ncbi:MAG TPA: type II secretion system F family protein [Planctomycetaceae bacterium]|jgi:tight adherence protein C